MAASVSTCNNSRLYIQSPGKILSILSVYSYSFLPFLYNLSDRLAESNFYFFYLMKIIYIYKYIYRYVYMYVYNILYVDIHIYIIYIMLVLIL